jgi:hypothetical protein
MRKEIVIIGAFLMFLGLIFMSISRSIAESDIRWVLVDSESASGIGTNRLSVEGNLTYGDFFLVNFTIRPPSEVIPDVAGVNVTITDPNNNKTSYDIEIGPGPQFLDPFPMGLINVTGHYAVEAISRFVNLTRLDLRKQEFSEKRYPYGSLLIVGSVIFGGGAGMSIIGLKASKHKKRISKFKK